MSGDSLNALAAEVDQYLVQADSLKYGDLRRMLDAAQAAGARAHTLGDFRRYAQALSHQAWAYSWTNQFERSLNCSLELLPLTQNHHFADIEAKAVGVVAFNFLKSGMWQEATRLYEHQLTLSEQLHDSAIQATALNDLSVVKLETGETDAALKLLERAADLMPSDTHDGLDRIAVYLNLSLAAVKDKRFDEAIRYAQKVLDQGTASPKFISDAYLCIASAYIGLGDLAEAHSLLEIARDCCRNAVPPIYNEHVEQITAQLLIAEERYDEAVEIWEKMYRFALKRHELDFAVNDLRHLKETYETLNDSAGVISAYKRLSEEIPVCQQQNSDLRFAVLRTVFTRVETPKSQDQFRLTPQKHTILQRLSHEFRTPLAIIQISAELVEKYGDKLSTEQRQVRLQRITAQVQWMAVMLDDVVELLKMDNDPDSPLDKGEFRLDDLAQAVLNQMDAYQVSNLHVKVHIEPGVERIHGIRKSLQIILVHLLTNAVKFSQDEVTLYLAVYDGVLVMKVSDQGVGSLPEEQKEAYKPLVRGTDLDEVTGTGLGLAIVARLVDQMQGIIDLTSEEGKGTTVTVQIPVSHAPVPLSVM